MLRATVEINLENAAFFDGDTFNPAPEVARILRKLADGVAAPMLGAKPTVWRALLGDSSGNTVGRFEMDCAIVTEDPR